jgi:tetratricopeptide (TPR) repeat protein
LDLQTSGDPGSPDSRGTGRRALSAVLGGVLLLASGCATMHPAPAAGPEVAAAPAPAPPAAPAAPPKPARPADPRAYYHYVLGYEHELAHEYDKALSEYLAALDYAPDSRDILTRTADLYLRNGDTDRAVATAEEALARYPDDPELLNFLSQLYLRQDDLDSAEKVYRRLIAVDPEDIKAYFLLALAYIRADRYDDAKALVAEARRRQPESPLPDYYLGRILREQGDDRGALKAFRKSMAKDPSFEAPYLDSADVLERQGKTDKARAMYERVVRDVDPRSGVARDQLIRLYLKAGDLDKVLAQFDAILAYNPQNVSVLFRKAVVLSEQDRNEEAIDTVQRILTLLPAEVRSMAFLGVLYEQAGRYEEARSVFQHILELEPDHEQAQIHLGYVADQLGDTEARDKAVAAVKRMSEEHPEDVSLKLYVAWGDSQAGRFEEAVEELKDALAVDPDNVEAHFSLGAAYYELKQFDDMVTQMRWVVDRDPRHADALNFLGYSYAERGENLDEAVDLIRRALDVQPDNGFFLDSLAWAYHMQGKGKSALKVQLKAIEKAPRKDPVLFDHLGSMYLALDRKSEAREAWIDALELDPDAEDLKERFKKEGFGDPDAVERILKAREMVDPGPPPAAAAPDPAAVPAP